MGNRKPLTIEQVLTMLTAAPPNIADSVRDALPDQLQVRPETDEWSANEILAHLRACADVWGGCIETIVAEDEPTIRGISPTHWIHKTDYLGQNFGKSLNAFSLQRKDLCTLLESLPEKDWSRSATVIGAGKPLVKTVFDYAQRLARHERPHLKQLMRTMQAFQ